MEINDKEFIEDIKYFWINHNDITRYSFYDRERLQKLNPFLLMAWDNYQFHKNMLDSLCN